MISDDCGRLPHHWGISSVVRSEFCRLLAGSQPRAGSRGRRFPAKRRPFWGGSVSGKSAFFMDNFGFGRGFVRKKRNFVADVIFRTVRCVNCFSSCWPSRGVPALSGGRRRCVHPAAGALCSLLGGRYARRRVAVRAYVQFGPEPPTPCAPGGGILPGRSLRSVTATGKFRPNAPSCAAPLRGAAVRELPS